MDRTTVFIPTDLRRRLADEARRRRQPQAALIREALAQYLLASPVDLPKLLGATSVPEVDAREAKAWVRQQWQSKASRT